MVSMLYGGWKMKIQLCAAQLMHCGVLMRIELTGHLDVNIRWLVDWLESFTGNTLTMFVEKYPEKKGEPRRGEVRLRGARVCVRGVWRAGRRLPGPEREQVAHLQRDLRIPGRPGPRGNLEMPVTSYPGGWKMQMRLCAAQLLNCDVLILDEPTGAWTWIISGCSGVKSTPYHVRGEVPGDDGALCNKEKHMQGTSAKYIMWR